MAGACGATSADMDLPDEDSQEPTKAMLLDSMRDEVRQKFTWMLHTLCMEELQFMDANWDDHEAKFKDQLSDILRSMAINAPQETSHFLRQIIVSAPNVGTAVIIRQAIDAFPPELQKDLKIFLRNYKDKKALSGS